MDIMNESLPWYAAGLAFECIQCGRCCAGPGEGYVWVTDEEIADIAKFLNLSVAQMRDRHVRKALRRLTLVERKDNHDCIFLTPPGTSRGCSIYSVRPAQCRTWPFWASNLENPDTWLMAGLRCPGLNRGRLWTYDEIQARLHARGS